MKTKHDHDKLLKRIVRLYRCVAQINTLPPESRSIDDIVKFPDAERGVVLYQVVLESTGDEVSWVLTDRDKPLWDEVVRKLTDLNPKVVSSQKVDRALCNLTSQYSKRKWSLAGLAEDAEALINTIVSEEGETKRVLLPIWGLRTEVKHFVIGQVEFKARSACPEIEDDLARFESARHVPDWKQIHTIATTLSSGDQYMLVQNAEMKVNQALNILRAFTQPIVQDPVFKQIGIMGTFGSSETLHWVEDSQTSANVVLKRPGQGYTSSGLSDRVIDQYLTDYVLIDTGFYKMSNFLTSPHSNFEAGLLRGAEWLGEATKPDTLESKFLKVAFAVDAMVGDESEDIPDKGQRARIAERSAFLLADKSVDRQRIYNEMSDFIRKRSKLAHGSKQQVSKWETERFGMYACGLLRALLQRGQNFKTVDQLAEWILQRSFESELRRESSGG